MAKAPKLSAILLASGHSTRFGSNKLLTPFQGRPLIETVLDHFPSELFHQTIVVTCYAPVAVCAAQHRFSIAENSDLSGDPATTIHLGMEALHPGTDGVLFQVCDQPLLEPDSIRTLASAFCTHLKENDGQGGIFALSHQGVRGNPVLFPATLFEELKNLSSGQTGTNVLQTHAALLHLVEVSDPWELFDVDTPEALEKAAAQFLKKGS